MIPARDNPFSVDRVLRIRFRPQTIPWEEMLARLDGLEYRGAIVGPKGSGKTTLLEDLEPRLRHIGFTPKPLRLDGDRRQFTSVFLRSFFDQLGDNDLILLDGAEQMPWLQWRQFRQRSLAGAGLIITTHAPGRLPTWIHCHTSPELLAEIASELLQIPQTHLHQQATTLFQKHHGNLREALLEWYDLVNSEPLLTSALAD